ncbi:hypothetical protein GMORB2_0155 [Geosmithia morbida]|uniref:Uncharacterized protein n=1 Tax=Geosmithia morbida TaxID=1094350 RepID=A0A9P4Z4C9_9HYPO|nr:uncharacterized protein GMORB2_0155 [Geosmithia morbida]KAF4126419.1 hypothetical protein GMORB2_0155 [Geosmithia morbida]
MSATPPLSAAERIRFLTNDDDVFRAFDSYPWTKDKTFLAGLYAILGKPDAPNNSQASLSDMATHARIFYYTQKIGVTIDFSRYTTWLANHPTHQPPHVLPEEYTNTNTTNDITSTPILDWQQAAPKADLYIDKERLLKEQQQQQSDQPAYPMGFAEMIKLLQEGKPVPGIRHIPNTIVRDPSVKPIGSRPVPRKPWERDTDSQVAHLETNEILDSTFPDLDTDTAGTNDAQKSAAYA